MREVFGADRIALAELDMEFGQDDIDAVVRNLKSSTTQCAVVFLGEMPYTEFKGNVETIELFQNQQDLVKAIHATGVPVIGVYVGGRPRTHNCNRATPRRFRHGLPARRLWCASHC